MRSGSLLEALCSILFFTWTVIGFGQSIWYDSDFTEWTTEPELRGIFLQDSRGYLWGWNSQYHLVRYNGYGLKSFHNGALIQDENSYNCIYWSVFFEDSRGNLWLGSNVCGLYRYDPSVEQFTFLSGWMEKAAGRDPTAYTSIIEDQQGLIWIATQEGVFFYDYKTGRFSHLKETAHQNASLLWEDDTGNIWSGSPHLSFTFLKIAKNSRKVIRSIEFPKFEVTNIRQFQYVKRIPNIKGEAYFLVFEGNPLLLNIDDEQIMSLSNIMEAGEEISAVCRGESSRIILGTNKGRIISYDHASNTFIPLVKQSLEESIYELSIDKSNSLWVSSQHKLYQINPSSAITSIVPYPKKHLTFGGVPDRLVNIDGAVYFVDPNELIPVLEKKEPIGLDFPFPHDSLQLKFKSDRENNRWVIAWSKSKDKSYYMKVDPGWNVLYLKACLDGMKKDCYVGTFSDITVDGNNNLWAGGWDGLFKIGPENGESQVFGRKAYSMDTANLLKEPKISALEADGNHIWIGYATKGISRYNLDAGTFDHYDSLAVEGVPLYNQRVHFIFKDKEGDIWFVTRNGLFRYISSLDTFKVYSVLDGLGENEVYHMIEDEQGTLWASTWRTVDKFARGEGRFYSFQVVRPGVDEISGASPAIDSEGNIFFALNEFLDNPRVLIVDPGKFQANKEVPPLLLESFFLSNKQVFINDATGVLEKSINLTDEITLRYQQNIFSIRYAALEYDHQDKVNFASQLEGFDKGWQYVGKKREATYTNLPPGNYTFKVKCQNHHGFWGEPRLLNIRILPPWYRTWLAYFLYVLAAAGFLFGIRRYELRRQLARAEARQLKALNAFKTRLYTNITHEFRTPLTVILGMAHEVISDPARWLEKGINMIRRNGQQLLRLVNQMLDLAKLESGNLQLELVNGDIVPYLAYLAESFHSFAESKEIELVIYRETEHLIMDYDPDKVLHVVSNLLSNAVKYTSQGGRIIFHTWQTVENGQAFLQIKVRDNGVGIPEADLPNIFGRFYQVDDSATRKGEGTGIGLSLARELVRLGRSSDLSPLNEEKDGGLAHFCSEQNQQTWSSPPSLQRYVYS